MGWSARSLAPHDDKKQKRKRKMKKYQPKPFTEELAEHFKKEMLKPCDNKRTLCNVIKLAFRNVGKESHNLPAARALLVEALWMGQRMSAKLEENRKKVH